MSFPSPSPARSIFFFLAIAVALLTLFAPVDAFAGPGGEIVEAAFKTRIGRIVMLIIGIILAPLILWYYLKMRRGVKQTREDLAELARVYPWFEWSLIEKRVHATAAAIYGEWSSGKLDRSARYLTAEYLQAQKDILQMWEDEGRRNVTEVKRFGKIVPLLVLAQDWTRPATVFVRIGITLKDFLVDKATGKTIKGSKDGFQEVNQIFIMVHVDGEWLLHAIEQGDEDLNLASTQNEILTPVTQLDFQRVSSKLAGTKAAEDEPATEVERPRVGVERQDHDR